METKKYYLYKKTSPHGLSYLGMTTKKDPFKYKGSGKYWKLHLKKHNLNPEDIITEILFETTVQSELKEKGLYYSKLYNIIESDQWANLIFETGEGVSGNKLTEDHKKKIGLAGLGRKLSNETIKLIAEKNRGRKNTAETKSKISASKIGKPGYVPTEETRNKIRNSKLGKLRKGVSVYNVETGEVFDSITKAAKSVGVNRSTLINHVKSKKEGCVFKYVDENYSNPRPNNKKGRIFSEKARSNMKKNNGMKKSVIHIETGKEFFSMVDAADFIGIKPDTLRAQLANNRKCAFRYNSK